MISFAPFPPNKLSPRAQGPLKVLDIAEDILTLEQEITNKIFQVHRSRVLRIFSPDEMNKFSPEILQSAWMADVGIWWKPLWIIAVPIRSIKSPMNS